MPLFFRIIPEAVPPSRIRRLTSEFGVIPTEYDTQSPEVLFAAVQSKSIFIPPPVVIVLPPVPEAQSQRPPVLATSAKRMRPSLPLPVLKMFNSLPLIESSTPPERPTTLLARSPVCLPVWSEPSRLVVSGMLKLSDQITV